MSACRGELRITGAERGIQGFSEGDVRRVGRRQIAPECPNAIKQQLMAPAVDFEIAERREGLFNAEPICTRDRVTTQDLQNLEVQKMRRVQRRLWVGDALNNRCGRADAEDEI